MVDGYEGDWWLVVVVEDFLQLLSCRHLLRRCLGGEKEEKEGKRPFEDVVLPDVKL